MKIFTSYFAKLKEIEKAGIVPIAVCQYPPKFYQGAVLKEVAPAWEMIQGMKDPTTRDFFAVKYELFLSGKDRQQILGKLEFMSGGKDVALLCFESPTNFCHRHPLARWLGLDPIAAELKFPLNKN